MASRSLALLVKLEVVPEQSLIVNELIKKADIHPLLYTTKEDHHYTAIFASKYERLPEKKFSRAFHNKAKVKAVTILGGDAIVCLLDDPESFLLHNQQILAMEFGAVSDYPIYTPHVTIGYTAKDCPSSLQSFAIEMLHRLTNAFQGFEFHFNLQKFGWFEK